MFCTALWLTECLRATCSKHTRRRCATNRQMTRCGWYSGQRRSAPEQCAVNSEQSCIISMTPGAITCNQLHISTPALAGMRTPETRPRPAGACGAGAAAIHVPNATVSHRRFLGRTSWPIGSLDRLWTVPPRVPVDRLELEPEVVPWCHSDSLKQTVYPEICDLLR